MKPYILFYIIAIVTLLCLSACSEEDPTYRGIPSMPDDFVVEPSISPSTVTVIKGTSEDFTAREQGATGDEFGVTWEVQGNTSTATTIMVRQDINPASSKQARLNVAANETATTLTVTATSALDQSKSGSATVTVINSPVVRIEVTPSLISLTKGDTQDFTAQEVLSSGPQNGVYWSIAGNNSSQTNITDSGHLTVGTNETTSQFSVIATSKIDPNKYETATVNMIYSYITSIVITPAISYVTKEASRSYTAIITATSGSDYEVVWSLTNNTSNNTSITADTDTINVAILTIGSDETATSLTITATSDIDPYKSGSATVNVVSTPTANGGYVFYDKGYYSDGWRYLESAPRNTEYTLRWGLYSIACPGTDTTIGSGRENTSIITNILIQNQQTGAARICDELVVNGTTDWFLPSKDELNEMYLVLGTGPNIGEFVKNDNVMPGSRYWSSSVYYEPMFDEFGQYFTWLQRFSDGNQSFSHTNYIVGRTNDLRIRAIRRF